MFSEPRRTKDIAEQRLGEQRLGEQLRREALAERPSFAPDLHARVMSAIAEKGDSSVLATLPTVQSLRRLVIRWSAIAAGLAVVAFGASQLHRSGGPPSLPGNSADKVVRTTSTPSEFTIDDFNHGASVALRLVVDQLPIEVPADDWGLPAIE
jgi:hypothetical protein